MHKTGMCMCACVYRDITIGIDDSEEILQFCRKYVFLVIFNTSYSPFHCALYLWKGGRGSVLVQYIFFAQFVFFACGVTLLGISTFTTGYQTMKKYCKEIKTTGIANVLNYLRSI